MSTLEREVRKHTFDAVAAAYDRSRPGYPEQMFDDVAALSALPEDGRILEIGPGTGHATLPFARRGYQIDGVELGMALAGRWRENLAGFPNATIRIGQFEDVVIPAGHYDLAIAASAFHWIDPDIGYVKVARALKPGGSIALWWNRHVLTETDQEFVEATGPIYARLAPELIGNDVFAPATAEPRPDQVRAFDKRINESGLFGPVAARQYEWSRTFDSGTFIDLLDSYSRYRVMEPAVRDRLFDTLRALIDEQFGGKITRGMVTFLYVARRSG